MNDEDKLKPWIINHWSEAIGGFFSVPSHIFGALTEPGSEDLRYASSVDRAVHREAALKARAFVESAMEGTIAEVLSLPFEGLGDIELACLHEILSFVSEEDDRQDGVGGAAERRAKEVLTQLAWSEQGSGVIRYDEVYMQMWEDLDESDQAAATALMEKSLAEEIRFRAGEKAPMLLRDQAIDRFRGADPVSGIDALATLIESDPSDKWLYLLGAFELERLEVFDAVEAVASKGLVVIDRIMERGGVKHDLEGLLARARRAERREGGAAGDLDLARLEEVLRIDPIGGTNLPMDELARRIVPGIEDLRVKRIPGLEDRVEGPLPFVPLPGVVCAPYGEQSDEQLVGLLAGCGLRVPPGLAEEIAGRGERVVALLIRLLDEDDGYFEQDRDRWGEIHAFYLLGAIGSPAGAPAVMEWLRTDPETDFATEATALVVGRMGEGAIDPVADFVADETADSCLRGTAALGLVQIGYRFPETRPALKETFSKLMGRFLDLHDQDGATALVTAFDTVPDPEIRAGIDLAFDRNLVDLGMCDRASVANALERHTPWYSYGNDREPMEHFSQLTLRRLWNISESWHEGPARRDRTFFDDLLEKDPSREKSRAKAKKKRKMAKKSRKKNRRR